MTYLLKLVYLKFIGLFPVIFICILTFVVWHKTLDQTFLGEGYYYFDRNQDFINRQGQMTDIWQLDIFARVLFDILPAIFQDNIRSYFIFQLITLAALNLVFYYTIYYFIKNRWIAIVAAIFFLSSYTGSFEMLGTGNYQRFVQRIPNLIPSFLSIILLGKFFSTKKGFYLAGSFFLFALSLILSHFSTFLLPVLAIYPLVWALYNHKKVRTFLVSLIISITFVALNYLLISGGFHTPEVKLNTLFTPQTCNLAYSKCREPSANVIHLERIVLQFSNIILPPFLIDKVATITNPFKNSVLALTLPIVFFLVLAFFWIKKNSPLKTFYLTWLFSIPAILYLNLYVGKVNPEINMSGYRYYFVPSYYTYNLNFLTPVIGDRYYFIPAFLIATVVSLAIWLIFNRGKNPMQSSGDLRYKAVIICLVALYFFYNTNIIWTHMSHLQPVSDDLKNYLNYVKSNSKGWTKDTTLVVHPPFIFASQYVRTFYGYPDTKFLPLKEGWEKELPGDTKIDLRIIDYDYQSKTIIDKTDNSKSSQDQYGKPR